MADLVVDGVIEGLEIALNSMRKGEISMVAINYKESSIICLAQEIITKQNYFKAGEYILSE